MLLLPEGKAGKSWNDYKKHFLSGSRVTLDRQVLSVSLFIKVPIMNFQEMEACCFGLFGLLFLNFSKVREVGWS